MDLDKISSMFIVAFLCLAVFSLLIYIIYTVISNEIKRKAWFPTMKVGDEVHFSAKSDVNGIISNINPNSDFVEVKFLVRKHLLYPGKVKDGDDFIIS